MSPLHIHEAGRPGAPAVVFLHGAGVSGRMWRTHMARLDQYHCLAPDLPGHGASRAMPWRSRIETADAVVRLIETRVPAQRAHVVGLSLGGAVAHTLLAQRSDVLDRVIIDGAGVIPWRWNPLVLAGVAAVTPFLHSRPVIAAMSRAVGGLSAEDEEDIRAASRGSFLRAWVQANETRPTPREVAAPCPTLLVAGERETLVRPSNAALAALMPHAVARYVPGCWHGWLGSEPELHHAMVAAWLAAAPLPDGLAEETIAWPQDTVARLLAQCA